MLMYGLDKPEIININFSGAGLMYNLTSLKEGFITLKRLIPPNNIGYLADRDFDIAYANYIMNNNEVFCEFFQIIYNLYIGKDVFILYSDKDWSENLMESLLKLIQQRYGYNAVNINCEEDYIFAQCNLSTNGFAPGYGLYNLDIDKERFSYVMEDFRLKNKGYLPFDLEGFIVPYE